MNVKLKAGLVKATERRSLSPIIQKAFMERLGVDGTYESFTVKPVDYEGFVEKVRNGMLDGFNVTIPYKEATVKLMDELSPVAKQIGSVNTVVARNGRLTGWNTDLYGLLRAYEEAGIEPAGMNVLLFGAGGAARAIICGLIEKGVSKIYIKNRTYKRAVSVTREFQKYSGKTKLTALADYKATPDDVELVVSALASGVISSSAGFSLPMSARYYFDVNYFEEEISLVKELRERGIRAFDGLPMLVHQGFRSLSLWLGEEPEDNGITSEVLSMLKAYTE